MSLHFINWLAERRKALFIFRFDVTFVFRRVVQIQPDPIKDQAVVIKTGQGIFEEAHVVRLKL